MNSSDTNTPAEVIYLEDEGWNLDTESRKLFVIKKRNPRIFLSKLTPEQIESHSRTTDSAANNSEIKDMRVVTAVNYEPISNVPENLDAHLEKTNRLTTSSTPLTPLVNSVISTVKEFFAEPQCEHLNSQTSNTEEPNIDADGSEVLAAESDDEESNSQQNAKTFPDINGVIIIPESQEYRDDASQTPDISRDLNRVKEPLIYKTSSPISARTLKILETARLSSPKHATLADKENGMSTACNNSSPPHRSESPKDSNLKDCGTRTMNVSPFSRSSLMLKAAQEKQKMVKTELSDSPSNSQETPVGLPFLNTELNKDVNTPKSAQVGILKRRIGDSEDVNSWSKKKRVLFADPVVSSEREFERTPPPIKRIKTPKRIRAQNRPLRITRSSARVMDQNVATENDSQSSQDISDSFTSEGDVNNSAELLSDSSLQPLTQSIVEREEVSINASLASAEVTDATAEDNASASIEKSVEAFDSSQELSFNSNLDSSGNTSSESYKTASEDEISMDIGEPAPYTQVHSKRSAFSEDDNEASSSEQCHSSGDTKSQVSSVETCSAQASETTREVNLDVLSDPSSEVSQTQSQEASQSKDMVQISLPRSLAQALYNALERYLSK